MSELVPVGTFCPYAECADYGQVGKGNVIQYGKSKQGQQRFQCRRCQRTFNERKGTLFYKRKTPVKDILECLALLAEGSRISSIRRVKGIKEDTILSFLREAADHAEQIEAILLNDYRIGRAEIDGLWTYVGRKRGKKKTVRPTSRGNTGAAPCSKPKVAYESDGASVRMKPRLP
jgi:transposase-like protein